MGQFRAMRVLCGEPRSPAETDQVHAEGAKSDRGVAEVQWRSQMGD